MAGPNVTVSIGAVADKAIETAKNLGAYMLGPLTNSAKLVSDTLSSGFATAGAVVGDILAGNLGRAVGRIGNFLTQTLQNTVGAALRTVLGETIGGALAELVNKIVGPLGNALTGLASRIVSAFTGPAMRAIGASLGDFDRWTDAAVKAEFNLTKFNAVVQAAGGVSGYTAQQLDFLAKKLNETTGQSMAMIRGAQGILLTMDKLRGESFRGALEASAKLAAFWGTDMETAARQLGIALSEPESATRRLRQMSVFLTDQQEKMIEAFVKSGQVAKAQELILSVLNTKYAGLAETLAGTTQVMLGRLQRSWELIGVNIGKIFLPLTKLTVQVTQGAVDAISGALMPVLEQLQAVTEGWVSKATAWLTENADTFRAWGDAIRGIVQNAANLIGSLLRRAFEGFDAGRIQSFWQAFSSGLSNVLVKLEVLTSNWDNFKLGVDIALAYLKNRFLDVWDNLTGQGEERFIGIWGRIWVEIKAGVMSLSDFLIKVLSAAFDLLGERAKMALNPALSEEEVQRALRLQNQQRELAIKLARQEDETANKSVAERQSKTAEQRRAEAQAARQEREDRLSGLERKFGAREAARRRELAERAQDEVDLTPHAPALPTAGGRVQILGIESLASKIQQSLISTAVENAQKDTAKNTARVATAAEETSKKLSTITEVVKSLSVTPRFS